MIYVVRIRNLTLPPDASDKSSSLSRARALTGSRGKGEQGRRVHKVQMGACGCKISVFPAFLPPTSPSARSGRRAVATVALKKGKRDATRCPVAPRISFPTQRPQRRDDRYVQSRGDWKQGLKNLCCTLHCETVFLVASKRRAAPRQMFLRSSIVSSSIITPAAVVV